MRYIFICAFLTLFGWSLNSQSSSKIVTDSLSSDTFEKTGILTFGSFYPNSINNSFIGKATSGNIGFKLGGQLFVYNRIFVGATLDLAFLDVDNPDIAGIYDGSRITSAYLQVGYEFKLSNKLSLGTMIVPYGHADYKNFIDEDLAEQQNDSAKIFMYEVYLSYDLSDRLSIFVDYSYRTDRTKIKTAAEIQDDFSKIEYHNIGVGLKFTISSGSFFKNL